jgi:Protein of unknown function (DUF629)
MSGLVESLESTAGSLPKFDCYWKLIEELTFPIPSKDIHKIKGVLEIIENQKITDIPPNIIKKLLKLSNFCLESYRKSKKSEIYQNLKKIKRFYEILKKLACMKYILFSCHNCNKVFKTKEYLRNHIKRRHSDELIEKLQSSISLHLDSVRFNNLSLSLNLSQEIENLRQSQLIIKDGLEKTLRGISSESPRDYTRVYKSVEAADFQNFLNEIGSKPSSPPLEEMIPQDLFMAAHLLEIDPVSDTHYLYIAKQFLNKPLPKDWVVAGDSFSNNNTGEIVNYHPGINHYKKIVRVMKRRKELLLKKFEEILHPGYTLMTSKYRGGIKAFFISDDSVIEKRKAEIELKITGQLEKIGKITMKLISKINKETEKRFKDNPELKNYSLIIESEAIRLKDDCIV